MVSLIQLALINFALSCFGFAVVRANSTTCVSSQLDWYTNIAGETPCMSYQRLRQLCDNYYTVGTLATTTPGDHCDSVLPDCCCNSISFALSMLCMNCQQDFTTGDIPGIDAPPGTYSAYLSSCSPVTNQTLATDIQQAVCNTGIPLAVFLYNLFWVDGSCLSTREHAVKDQEATNNNTFTYCSQNAASPTAATRTSGSTGPDTREIAGIAAGCVVATIFSLLGLFLWCRRKDVRKLRQNLVEEQATPHQGTGSNVTNISFLRAPGTASTPLRLNEIETSDMSGIQPRTSHTILAPVPRESVHLESSGHHTPSFASSGGDPGPRTGVNTPSLPPAYDQTWKASYGVRPLADQGRVSES
ncbi:hypothetical protein BDN67DRAFT_931143 [Paxillus ammoniavirescens]|nr:hypothetical protein BDN67DRAFT_931143 [Paxillus ammoniavirescens]